MAIIWDEAHSVNVKEIDDQHKYFINLLNEFYRYIAENKDRDFLGENLVKLIDYAKEHFATEEKYFDLFNYENTVEHKEEHRQLENKVADFYQEFLENKKDISVEIIDFLEDWLVDHLDTQDKKYTKCFNEHGLF